MKTPEESKGGFLSPLAQHYKILYSSFQAQGLSKDEACKALLEAASGISYGDTAPPKYLLPSSRRGAARKKKIIKEEQKPEIEIATPIYPSQKARTIATYRNIVNATEEVPLLAQDVKAIILRHGYAAISFGSIIANLNDPTGNRIQRSCGYKGRGNPLIPRCVTDVAGVNIVYNPQKMTADQAKSYLEEQALNIHRDRISKLHAGNQRRRASVR